jgi:hypothetical protein
MLMTGGDAAGDQRLIALEIDQTNVGAIADQSITVAPLQSGACDRAVSARTTALVDPSGDCLEPGPTILVSEETPLCILSTLATGRSQPTSSYSHRTREARSAPMVDFPHPETPMTITTAGRGGKASFVGRVWVNIVPLLLAPRRDL